MLQVIFPSYYDRLAFANIIHLFNFLYWIQTLSVYWPNVYFVCIDNSQFRLMGLQCVIALYKPRTQELKIGRVECKQPLDIAYVHR